MSLVLGAIIGFLVNLASDWVVSQPAVSRQREVDAQLAQLYQTETSRFFLQFRVNLNWLLPRAEKKDTRVDNVFHYDTGLVEPIALERLNHDVLRHIFNTYDFSKAMPNFNGDRVEPDVEPTGLNCLLGNLDRFNHQMELHLQKLSSATSPELYRRVEHARAMAKAQADSIRLDMAYFGTLPRQTTDGLADFIVELRNGALETKEKYESSVSPSVVGIVTKKHPTEGQIAVQWEYGKYKKGRLAAEKP
jgi:hypothetical protein